MELAIIQPKEIINKVGYASEHDNEIGILKKQKILMHRFIYEILNASVFYYYVGLQLCNKLPIEIYFHMPFKSINNDSIILEYEYYKDVYKTNNTVGLINRKYFINYIYIGLYDSNKFNNEIKNMKLTIILTLK